MKREIELKRMEEQAKGTTCAALAINITKSNLTRKEKRKFEKEGFVFAINRINSHLLMNYTQEARLKDLRKKLRVGKEILKRRKVTLQYIRVVPSAVEISIDEAINLIKADYSHRNYSCSNIGKAIRRGIRIQLANHTLQMVGVGIDANLVLGVV